VNLERITRDQWPSYKVNYCAAVFFSPYEDLDHELGMQVVNDAITVASAFIARGYRGVRRLVFFFVLNCDQWCIYAILRRRNISVGSISCWRRSRRR
jgi:hypothetical protein